MGTTEATSMHKANDHCLTFVDNFFTTCRSPQSAAEIIDDAASYLFENWKLSIGDGTRIVLPVTGCDASSFDAAGWTLARDMRCLGQRLASTCTIAADFEETSAKLWGSFYANLQPSLLNSPLACRLQFLKTCVRPVASFRWSRWPFQPTYAKKLDGIQNHMTARLLQVKQRPGEDFDIYFSRRRRLCAEISGEHGKWSTSWAQSCLAWEAHVRRGNDPNSWSKPIYEWHGSSWIHAQRVRHARGGATNRTGARSGPGRPATRYYEGVAHAREALK